MKRRRARLLDLARRTRQRRVAWRLQALLWREPEPPEPAPAEPDAGQDHNGGHDAES